MSAYKLTYFNITGLAEPIRFLMSYGGLDFEDNRIDFNDWPNLKPKMPMQQMPILEIDGKVYNQARAICRYFAKKFNLYGIDDLEALEIDACVDDIEDMRSLVARYNREDNPVYKAKCKLEAQERVPFFLNKFEERVNKNGGFFVAEKLSIDYIHSYLSTNYIIHLRLKIK